LLLRFYPEPLDASLLCCSKICFAAARFAKHQQPLAKTATSRNDCQASEVSLAVSTDQSRS
jgi:hypothetical protein